MAGLGNCFPCWTEYRRAVAAVIKHLDTPMCHAHAKAEGVEVPLEAPIVTICPKPVDLKPETAVAIGKLAVAAVKHIHKPAAPAEGEQQVKKKCESSDCGQEFTPKPNEKHGYCSSRCYAREHYRKTHPKAGKGDVVSVTRVAVADPAKSPKANPGRGEAERSAAFGAPQCEATKTDDGSRCRLAARKGGKYCHFHSAGDSIARVEAPPIEAVPAVVSVTLREAVLDRLWFTLTPEQKASAISSSLNGV